jgi:predicted 2-oxoglutarate/Fe(II)-dependent dioxygenase YbiX
MQLNTEYLDTNIIYYKDVVSNPNDIIKYFEEENTEKWEDWLSSNDKNIRHGFSKTVVFNNSHKDIKLIAIVSEIRDAVVSAVSHYRSEINGKNVSIPPFFDIKKYTDGANMGTHSDSEDSSDKNHPLLSAVLYLNDDYVGGEIEFSNQQINLKALAGSLIIFPSVPPYYHRPMPVISGTKYMIPFFFYEEGLF